MYEGDSRIRQSWHRVVSVSWVLGLVRDGVPVEVEEEVGVGGNLPTRQQGGMVGGEGGNGFREACRGRVYLRWGADEPQASKAALVVYKSRQWGKTGFPVQTYRVGGRKTVSDPPIDPTPENGHPVHDRWGRNPDS